MINHAVVSDLFPGMIGFSITSDKPGVIDDKVDGVGNVVVDVTNDVDQHDYCLERAVDEKVFDSSHSVDASFQIFLNPMREMSYEKLEKTVEIRQR